MTTTTRTGRLTVAATPIGNLQDISRRLKTVLTEADKIYCEDTRKVQILLKALDLKKPVRSLFEGNETRASQDALQDLEAGKHVALVSEAGCPGVSDPGSHLVSLCLDRGITVSPVPGPSAVTAAWSASGFAGDGFLFVGFLSRRSRERATQLKELAETTRGVILFESPKRIHATLKQLEQVLGGARQVTLLREISKLHEEVVRRRLDQWVDDPPRPQGEFTVVVQPATQLSRQQAITRRFSVLREQTTLQPEAILDLIAFEFQTSPKRLRYLLKDMLT